MNCPYCKLEMELGFIYAPAANASYWLPKNKDIDSMTISNKKIEELGGFTIGKTTKVGLLSKQKPESYHCPTCKILLTKLDS